MKINPIRYLPQWHAGRLAAPEKGSGPDAGPYQRLEMEIDPGDPMRIVTAPS
jgi:hypothetical protein